MLKKHAQKKLERYVRKYFKKHHPKLVVVVGGIGKTTTKSAITTVLATKFSVGASRKTLDEQISVPFGILGIKYPSASSLLDKSITWRMIFKAIRERIKAETHVDVIIQEIATERPGEIAHYAKYLHPDVAVVTAVAPECTMNFPNGIDDVAREELSVAKHSKLTVINYDDVDMRFAPFAETTNITNYGLKGGEYRFEIIGGTALDGYVVKFFAPEFPEPIETTVHLVGEHMLKGALAAGLVAAKFGMTAQDIAMALSEVRPVHGCMNPLRGVRETTIIDDTYSSNPYAAIEALRTLYLIDAPQRVAILGSMNDLGQYSAQYHKQVGEQCDPNFLDWVITIGEEAAHYLAPVAKANGCQVATFPGPIFAGTFANKILEPGGVILIKGSQENVFAEESVKLLLHDVIEQQSLLVRQDEEWMAKKNAWIASLRDIKQDND